MISGFAILGQKSQNIIVWGVFSYSSDGMDLLESMMCSH